MKLESVCALWAAYQARDVDMTLDPTDHMVPNKYGLEGYRFVGQSGARVICSALSLAHNDVMPTRVLDFACGAGRVARHIRVLLPEAKLFFADIDAERSAFCAKQFNGDTVPAVSDFDKLVLPKDLDIIWVGSLFTHIDYARMLKLFSKLWMSLRPNGCLIATFHGRAVLEAAKSEHFIDPARWERIVTDFANLGVGYQSYGSEGYLSEVGVSLTTSDRVIALANGHSDARLICYSEKAWASLHDVATWMKVPPQS